MRDKVITDAIADFRQYENNVLEDLAQMRQSVNLVVELIELIAELYVAAKRGWFKHIRRRFAEKGHNIPRHIANGWLMYFYGISPLISTIEGILSTPDSRSRTYRAFASVGDELDPKGYTNAGFFDQCTGTVKRGCRCVFSATLDLSKDQIYLNSLGYTGTTRDLALTAWALLPYSFIVDWFIPISDFIQSLSWSSSVKYYAGYISRHHEGSATLTTPNPFYGVGWSGKLPKSKLEVLFFNREVLYIPPSPGLSVRLSLSSNSLISAVALIPK
jgi:hypothetical protein